MPFLNRPHARLHYVSLGPTEPTGDEQPPFLLIHGLAANLAFWYARIAPTLARHHRVVMFDLRGHGRTSMPATGYHCDDIARDARALLDHLQIKRAHVVGHSFGGNVALHFAWRWPARTASLTMADVRVRSVQPRVDLQAWAAWPRIRSHLAEVGITIDETADEIGFHLFDRIARLRLEQTPATAQSPVLALSPFAGAGGEAAARLWVKLIETTTAGAELMQGAGLLLADIERIAAPTLLVYGEHSQTLPTALALRQHLPSSRLEIAAGGGHFFPTKHPDKLVAPLLAFVGKDGGPVAEATRGVEDAAPLLVPELAF